MPKLPSVKLKTTIQIRQRPKQCKFRKRFATQCYSSAFCYSNCSLLQTSCHKETIWAFSLKMIKKRVHNLLQRNVSWKSTWKRWPKSKKISTDSVRLTLKLAYPQRIEKITLSLPGKLWCKILTHKCHSLNQRLTVGMKELTFKQISITRNKRNQLSQLRSSNRLTRCSTTKSRKEKFWINVIKSVKCTEF